ncbi:MAG: hypothetical protein DRP64_06570, partial [Verrucomicrobia bacterium]
ITSSHSLYVTIDGTDPREYGTGMPTVALSYGSVVVDQSMVVKARNYNNGQWSALTEAAFTVDSPTDIRISEIMAHAYAPTGSETNHPFTAEDYEFIELFNAGTETVGLAGLQFVKGVSFDFSTALIPELQPGGHALVVADLDAFQLRYPAVPPSRIAGEYTGRLDDDGETVELAWPALSNSVSVAYNNGWGWPPSCEGAGHSLIPNAHPEELLNHAANWNASCYIGGSPGEAEPACPDPIVINELIAHTDTGNPPPFESNDIIELYNPTDAPIIFDGYWYLSDDFALPEKWNIPDGTTLPAHGWVVFDEDDFHPERIAGFGLDKAGEQVVLSHRPGAGADRVVDSVEFEGQANGASWGRYPDANIFFQTLEPTAGTANQLPNPTLWIENIMYHPYPLPGHNVTEELEYIRIVNPSVQTIVLSSDGTPKTWRLNDGIDYSFTSNLTLNAGETLWVVPFDPAVESNKAFFCATYGLDAASARLLGPYSGNLSNDGERIVLERPQASDDLFKPDEISWIIVDEAAWLAAAPWPPEADGAGQSLSRIGFSGTDPLSWTSNYDSDQDGQSDWAEYIAGTNPTDPASQLRITVAHPLESGGFIMYWDSVLGRSYSVYWASNLLSSAEFQTTLAYPVDSYTDLIHLANSSGFYFLETQVEASPAE